MRARPMVLIEDMDGDDDAISDVNRQGQWLRRRTLDGSLNRVPIKFYSQIWKTLEKCQGIQIYGYTLNQSLTREMTEEELKFALLVEEALNRIPEPEYRQIIVEACMLLTLLAQQEPVFDAYNEIIVIDSIVAAANKIFLEDQRKMGPDGLTCCVSNNKCCGAVNICENFYDLAPSGHFGSMNYIFKSLARFLKITESPDLHY